MNTEMQQALARETTPTRLAAIEQGKILQKMSPLELVLAVEVAATADRFLELVTKYWDEFDEHFFETVDVRLGYLDEHNHKLLNRLLEGVPPPSFSSAEATQTGIRLPPRGASETDLRLAANRHPEIDREMKSTRQRSWVLVNRANGLRTAKEQGIPLSVAISRLRLPSDGLIARRDILDIPPYFLEPSPEVMQIIERKIAVDGLLMSTDLSYLLKEMYSIKSKSGRLKYFIGFVADCIAHLEVDQHGYLEVRFQSELNHFQSNSPGTARPCFLSMYKSFSDIMNSMGRGENVDDISCRLLGLKNA
jgi:hypothetical protein